MLQPLARRTWSPKGLTPLHKSWDRRERLSVISAITVSPYRARMGLYFAAQRRNIVHGDFEAFIAGVMRLKQTRMILVVDRWSVHRAGVKRLLKRFSRRLEVEWLPAYAPELNPVEQVWSRSKYVDLANYIPADVDKLGRAVRGSLTCTRNHPDLLKSFFKHAKLKLS